MANKWAQIDRGGSVLYDFDAAGKFQISLKAGSRVHIVKESSGWYKGYPEGCPSEAGIFPVSFVDVDAEEEEPPPPPPEEEEEPPPPPEEEEKEDEKPPAPVEETKPAPVEKKPAPFKPKPLPPLKTASPAPKPAPAARNSAFSPARSPVSPGLGPSSPVNIPASGGRQSKFFSSLTPVTPDGRSSLIPGSLIRQGSERFSEIHKAAPLPEYSETDAALVEEIAKSMREWSAHLKTHLVTGNPDSYHELKERISGILVLRREFADAATSPDRKEALRKEMIELIESRRKMDEGYMVPRNEEGKVADTSNTGVMALLELHRTMYQTLREESATKWKQKAQVRREESLKTAAKSAAKEAAPESRVEDLKGSVHLYVDVKMCLFSVGEATELHFALYSAKDQEFVTESYCLRLTSAGFPEELSMLGKMQTLFANLNPADFEKDLYLVCRIYRRGWLVYDPKQTKPPKRMYKRPFGCSAMRLGACDLAGKLGQELTPPNDAMKIWCASTEARFSDIHKDIIAGSKDLEEAPRAKGIALGLTMYNADLRSVLASDEERFSEVMLTRKLWFPDVIDPADTRNELFVRIEQTNVSQGTKKTAKNVEVLLHVMTDDGTVVENCISRGSGDAAPESLFRTSVFYHCNSPNFDELIKLQIPPAVFEKCHLLFTFWHVSSSEKKNAPFSFGWFKLTDIGGATIKDGSYNISSYKPYSKMADNNKIINFAGASYLKMLPKECKPDKSKCVISTTLLSTLKSQDQVIHSIIHWDTANEQSVSNCLDGFLRFNRGIVPELVKVMRAFLNALFRMLCADRVQRMHAQVIECLYHALSLLGDPKMSFFQQLDEYTARIFDFPTVHHKLVALSTTVLDTAFTKPTQGLKNLCESLKYVIKFIVASRHQDQESDSPSCSDEVFTKGVENMMGQFNGIVSMAGDSTEHLMYARPAQASLVRSFPGAIDDLAAYFSGKQLGSITQGILDAIPDQKAQNINKLNLVRNLLAGTIGNEEEARTFILPTVLDTLKVHLKSIDQEMSLSKPYLCISILRKLLQVMQTPGSDSLDVFIDYLEDIVHTALVVQKSLTGEIQLTAATDTITSTVKVDPLVDSLTILWTLLIAISGEKIHAFVDQLPRERKSAFLQSLMEVATRSFSLTVYPDMWVLFNFFQIVSIRTICTLVVSSLHSTYSGENFDQDLWTTYFGLAFKTLTCEALHLESYSTRKQQFAEERFGDIRVDQFDEIRDMWSLLGDKKVLFFGQFVPQLFDLFNSAVSETRSIAMDIMFDMIEEEYSLSKGFAKVEQFAVDALYQKEESHGTISVEESQKFMDMVYAGLKERLDESEDDAMQAAGQGFLDHLRKMHSLMSSLLHFPATAMYEDERTSVALKLINYIEESGLMLARKEMYTRYVQFLIDLHSSLSNPVEAGMTQLQQLKVLDWSENTIGAVKPYPAEQERVRRERLYKSAIQFFLDGQDYERALSLSADLRWYYQCKIYDYDKLSQLLRDEAGYYQKIGSQDRFYSNYFRVVYHGEGFDEELREKEFVYRGIKLEPVMDFTNRLKLKFPNAKIRMSSDPPSDEDRAKDNQIIGITTLVRPPLDVRRELMQKRNGEAEGVSLPSNAPKKVLVYHDNSTCLGVFEYSKGDQRSTEKKPKNEFKDLWVAKTYIFTEDSFPNNRRRMAVVHREEVTISPLQNAVTTIQDKNVELQEKIEKVARSPPGPVDVGPLSMNLNGIIDAAVNGGTKLYIEAFLCDEYLQLNPNDQGTQDELKDALRAQVHILERGLKVFGKRCDEKLLALHQHLSGFYSQMKDSIRKELGTL